MSSISQEAIKRGYTESQFTKRSRAAEEDTRSGYGIFAAAGVFAGVMAIAVMTRKNKINGGTQMAVLQGRIFAQGTVVAGLAGLAYYESRRQKLAKLEKEQAALAKTSIPMPSSN